MRAGTGLYRVEMTATAGEKELGARSDASAPQRRRGGALSRPGSIGRCSSALRSDTGGRYWRLDDLGGLPEAMRYSNAGMVERQTLDLWNLPTRFLLLLLLKAGEWLLRRTGDRL